MKNLTSEVSQKMNDQTFKALESVHKMDEYLNGAYQRSSENPETKSYKTAERRTAEVESKAKEDVEKALEQIEELEKLILTHRATIEAIDRQRGRGMMAGYYLKEIGLLNNRKLFEATMESNLMKMGLF